MINLQSYADRIQHEIIEARLEEDRVRHGVYYWNNREKVRESARAYYLANQDALREIGRIYYAENKELVLKRVHLYQQSHPDDAEYVRARKKLYRATHKAKTREANRLYREANREKLRAKSRAYKAKKKAEQL